MFYQRINKANHSSGADPLSAVLHEQKLISRDNSLTVLAAARSDTSGLQKREKAGGCTTEFTVKS